MLNGPARPMRIFVDNSVPAGLRRYLRHYQVATAPNQRWERLENGDLLKAVETAGFDVMITSDQNLEYQQNLSTSSYTFVEVPLPPKAPYDPPDE